MADNPNKTAEIFSSLLYHEAQTEVCGKFENFMKILKFLLRPRFSPREVCIFKHTAHHTPSLTGASSLGNAKKARGVSKKAARLLGYNRAPRQKTGVLKSNIFL